MQVVAKVMCFDVMGPVKGGNYEVPEGTDIAGLIGHIRAQFGLDEQPELADLMQYLRNGSPAVAGTVLQEGDTVFFLRKIYGG